MSEQNLHQQIEFLNHHLKRHPHIELMTKMDQYERTVAKLKNRPLDIASLISSASPLVGRFMGGANDSGAMVAKFQGVSELFSQNNSSVDPEAERRSLVGKRDALFCAIVKYVVAEITAWLSRGSANATSLQDDGYNLPSMVDFGADSHVEEDSVTGCFGDALAHRLRVIVVDYERGFDDQATSIPSPEKLIAAASQFLG